MNPQLYEYAVGKLFKAGTLDVWLTPILMKKNRPGTSLSALCRPTGANEIVRVMLEETTTLGVRRREVQREAPAREIVTVETTFGPVGDKVARLDGQVVHAQPECEDCRGLAEVNRVPLPEV